MQTLFSWAFHFAADESGQDLIEYGLLCALIGLAAITSMRTLANHISSVFVGIPMKVMAAIYGS